MISFRFHLVSLVGVFLALGLGVLTGTTVVNQGIVARLEAQTNELDVQADQLRGEVQELEAAAAQWQEFGDDVFEPLAGARLAGEAAVLVTQEGTDPATLDRVREALEVAGAEVALELRVGRRMALESEDDVAALSEAIGRGTADPPVTAPELAVEAAQSLADRVAFGPSSTDVFDELEAGAFLAVEGTLEPPDERPITDPFAVVVAGGPSEAVIAPNLFLVPMISRLVGNGLDVLGAEPQTSTLAFVTTLRELTIADEIATVDHADRLPGAVALVLAAEDLVEDGQAGHYGVKPGASGLLPPL